MSDGTVDISLVSHTNQGKTTLVRTLLRRDVGEVLDRAHVTDQNTPYTLIADGADELVLWDTPGFGDSARLLKRLRGQENPLGWFVGQVWDRLADRPLWCSQQAVINVRDEADVVLYLVNASEAPEAAGYLEPELAILEWIGRPVLVVLNQTGPPRAAGERDLELEAWRAWAAGRAIVHGVLPVDAFTRCWIQEGVLLERIGGMLEGERAERYGRLMQAWRARHAEILRQAVDALTEHVATAATDRVALPRNDRAERKRAGELLRANVKRSARELTQKLIELHELEGRSANEIEAHFEDLDQRGSAVDDKAMGLVGGLVGGALGGLVTDFISGGLTFGGGAVVGALTGALGSIGLARTQRVLKRGEEPSVVWTGDFLVRLTAEALVFYLAVAHYGRGRGEFRDLAEPEHWRRTVTSALANRKNALTALADELRAAKGEESRRAVRLRVRSLVEGTLQDVLSALYPEGARWSRA